ncbi:type II secretion system protein [Phycisphaerales bacterium AB-hyl4]|uniref:Type II secretion system protein n=1 Tax=Natronomicrosphaera hydrolytica TaxID=3242702 RepID=A0ABV4U3M9_9BACT
MQICSLRPTPARTPLRCRGAGFSLVEILIVVLLLSILAAMVIPQFIGAAEQTRDNALATNLSRVRQQIELYRHHHDGNFPELANFTEQLTKSSNALGQTAAVDTPGYSFGPYLSSIPRNPYTAGNIVGDGEVGTSDWYYNENTGDFHANHDEDAREL